MENNLQFIFHIGVLLIGANIGGLVSKKFKQPVVLGQIIAGIILGVMFLQKTEFITQVSEIGVIFLMFLAGLETDVKELKETGRASAVIAILGVIFPIVLVSGITFLLTRNIIASTVLGLISIATSVSISVETLREIGFLRSKQGTAILGAAIIDDIIGVVLLTLIIGISNPTEELHMGLLILKIVAVFLIISIAGILIIKLSKHVPRMERNNERMVGFAIGTCLMLAFVAQVFGVAAITGAYFAGVILSMTPFSRKVVHDVQTMANIFFTPLFFATMGLGVQLNAITQGIVFSLIVLGLGIIGKIAGCGIGARLTGFGKEHALQIGIGMVPRAEVSLIIANLGITLGLISEEMFSSAILLVIVTTLVTPFMLKWSFRNEEL